MMVNLVLDRGKVIRVSGPASIEVVNGEVLIAGAVFTAGCRVVINRLRSYGVKALNNSELRVVLGDGASLEEPREGEEVIDSWLELCGHILKSSKHPLRIIVLGPVESGKTSLSAFITNYLLREGFNVYLVDADIGQADVAAPCTISVAIPKRPFIWQRELEPTTLKFVGCTSPQYCSAQLISAFQELINELALGSGKNALVVDTDGWVSTHQALELKQLMIKILKPTHILILDENLYSYFRNVVKSRDMEVIFVPRPRVVRERSRDDRRYLRGASYSKLFVNARRVKLNLSELTLFGSCVLAGNAIGPEELSNYVKIPENLCDKVTYASLYNNMLNIVVKKGFTLRNIEPVSNEIEVNIINEGDERGILVGILDSSLRDVSVGIIESIDYNGGTLTLLTPWEGAIGGLIVGKIKLSDKFEEVGKVSKCLV